MAQRGHRTEVLLAKRTTTHTHSRTLTHTYMFTCVLRRYVVSTVLLVTTQTFLFSQYFHPN